MKKKKRFTAAIACLLALAAVLSGGCAGVNDAEKAEIEKQVLAANKELMEAKSIKGEIFMNYSFGESWQTHIMSMVIDFEEMSETGVVAVAPDKMHIKGMVAVDGVPTEMEAYSLSNGDGTQTVYSCTGDTARPSDWTIETQDIEEKSAGELDLVNGMLGMDEFRVETVEKDTSDGRAALKIKGLVDAEKFAGVAFESLGIDGEQTQGTEAAYTVWLDAENKKMLEYEIDLKDVVKSALEAVLEARGLNKDSVELRGMTLGMRVDEINGEYDFTLPAAVREKLALEDQADLAGDIMARNWLEQLQ